MENRSSAPARPGLRPALCAIFIAQATFAASALWALGWPVADPKIASGFGTAENGRFVPGATFVAGSQSALASDDGEVLFVCDGPATERVPRAMGSWTAIAHKGELATVYARLKSGSLSDYYKDVKAGDMLGIAGDDDRNGDENLELIVFDREKSQFVNPLLFLPADKDRKPPVIRSVFLRRDSTPVELSQARSFRQGLCELTADFADQLTAEGGPRSAPYMVRVLLNGAEKLNLRWDTLRESKGSLVLFSDEGVSCQAFALGDGRFRLGSIAVPRGRMNLEVIVSDYALNARSQASLLVVD